jgi:hypothetical protein
VIQGRHRSDFRKGPWHAFARRKAEILRKLVDPGRILERLVAEARQVGPDTYQIRGGSALILRAKVALDEWRPLANDTEGDIWD